MQSKILLIFVVFLMVSIVSALDSQLPYTCGGDNELTFGCMGDDELFFIGSIPVITPSIGSINRRVTLPDFSLQQICNLSQPFLRKNTINGTLFFPENELSELRNVLFNLLGLRLENQQLKESLAKCTLIEPEKPKFPLIIFILLVIGVLMSIITYRNKSVILLIVEEIERNRKKLLRKIT